MYIDTAIVAYLFDRLFGEFNFIRHPVVLMGDYILWFEKWFYQSSVIRGTWLAISLVAVVFSLSYGVQCLLSKWLHPTLQIIVSGIVGSVTIASKMLYDSVKDIIVNPQYIKYLVSRDTKHLSASDIHRAAIETYAENLSDGVIAPFLYLLFFGIPGAFVYKSINTLDSMVGYKNERYEKFGKFSARLDDIANYIPARITAILITLVMPKTKNSVKNIPLYRFYQYGKQHDSPNAGHPIAAMALSLGIKLGGPTSYFGKIKKKAWLVEGRESIPKNDISLALSFQRRFDILFLLYSGLLLWA